MHKFFKDVLNNLLIKQAVHYKSLEKTKEKDRTKVFSMSMNSKLHEKVAALGNVKQF